MSWSVSAQNHLLARAAVMPRWLLWVEAKEFGTMTPSPLGLWNGDDDLTFTIGGGPRVYLGALAKFEVDPIIYGTGVSVQTLNIMLAANAPETEDLVRGFVIRLAAVELHLALLDPLSHDLIDVQPMFTGFINRAPLSTPSVGGGDTVTLELVTSMRRLALSGPALKKTNQSQIQRDATDDFRQYGAVAAEVQTEWVKK